MSGNPYQAPAVAVVMAAETDAETMRRRYLSHEFSVKGVSSLYLLGGVLGGIGLLLSLFGVFYAGAHGGLTKSGRILGAVIAGISLIVVPIGTLIGAYILYLLLGPKGKVVFSPEYRAVIAQTPHIRYRTPLVVWILLIVLLLIILFAIFVGTTA